MFILLAEVLTAGEAEPEEDEKIISRAYTRKQLEGMIRGGELRDAKSIAGILFYFRFLSPQDRPRKYISLNRFYGQHKPRFFVIEETSSIDCPLDSYSLR